MPNTKPLKVLKPYSLVFVDTETTGTSPTYNNIIEIGIVRVESGVVVDTYQTLVRPPRGLPDIITNITGITNEALLNAPSFEEVALVIKEKLEGAIMVAHNARFDYSFIKNEFKRLGISYNAKTLCTVKLSRTLFPHHAHHNLDAIIERFGIACEARHRAYDDAWVLWEFVQKLSDTLEEEELERALQECLGNYTLPPSAPKAVVKALPHKPGVYIFYGEGREVLYVGKSVDIKSRVMSHFSGDHASAKELTMCSQVHDIEARVTSGELSALFLESKLIKELAPVYNRLLRKVKQLAVLQEELTPEGYKTASVAYEDTLNLAELGSTLGVFRTVRQAKDFLNEAIKEHALCAKVCGLEKVKAACFQYQLERCLGACIHKESAKEYNKRFDKAFSKRRLRAWPYKGPVVIKEEVEEYEGIAYVIDKWCVYKTIMYTGDFMEESEANEIYFDYDSYKILARHLLKPAVRRSVVAYEPRGNKFASRIT